MSSDKNTSPEKVFVTKKEAAELLRCDQTTIDRWAKAGKFPKFGIGGKILFRLSDIEDSIVQIN